MQRIAIIGHTGFVGTYIHRIYPDAYCFNSKNINEIKGQFFDLIFCCGISAVKWLANKEPIKDLANINSLYNILEEVNCAKFILISTIDIYSTDCISNDEDIIQSQTIEAYGKNRFDFEQRINKLFKDRCVIIRLSALFGFGLKKNLIFDLIHNKTPIKLNPQSYFQWYSMEWLQNDLNYILKNDKIQTINLFCEPISNMELITCLNYDNKIDFTVNQVKQQVYKIKTKYKQCGWWRSKNACLSAIKRYVIKMTKNNNIIVSSLTCKKINLTTFNISQLEIAPYSFFGEDFLTKPLEFFTPFKNQIYSFQGLFYPNHQWKLDTHFNQIESYLCKLIDIAIVVGCKILVFGSPKLRSVNNAYHHMSLLLNKCNDYICNKYNDIDLNICIEPNSTYYNCNFLTNLEETYQFVTDLNLQHIKLMCDLGNMYLENEHIDVLFKYAHVIRHVHFSAPNLIALNRWQDAYSWPFIISKLKKLNYKYNFTLECLNISESDLNLSLYDILKDVTINVVGLGWYGCHIASSLLNHGYNVIAFEKEIEIFKGVSSHNQNRLHMGFHYPRSYNTRLLCQSNYEKFLQTYGFMVTFIEKNIYYISNESCIDFETFKQIMNAHHLQFDEIENNQLKNVNSKCLQVQEGVIDFRKAITYFQEDLFNHVVYKDIHNLNELNNRNLVLDCTYNNFKRIANTTFEPSLSLIYHKKNNISNVAITIMDGHFWSLYPYDLELNLYTLTHVLLGRSESFNIEEIQMDIMRYYPSFLDNFEYVSHFLSQKCLMKSTCASRELQYISNNNHVSALCGKITGIFEFESLVFQLIQS